MVTLLKIQCLLTWMSVRSKMVVNGCLPSWMPALWVVWLMALERLRVLAPVQPERVLPERLQVLLRVRVLQERLQALQQRVQVQ
jgi:hypothetical protein